MNVIEKEEGKLQVRNRETGEETYLDEEFLSTEASVFKKAQEEGIIDIEEKIEEEEKGEEKRKEEKEPDVSVEEDEEKDEEKSEEKEKSEENIEMGEGIYKEYLMEVVTDPEIAPLVLEKLIRKFEDEDEILSKLEAILPEGEIEDDEYWVKNAGIISKKIVELIGNKTGIIEKESKDSVLANFDEEIIDVLVNFVKNNIDLDEAKTTMDALLVPVMDKIYAIFSEYKVDQFLLRS